MLFRGTKGNTINIEPLCIYMNFNVAAIPTVDDVLVLETPMLGGLDVDIISESLIECRKHGTESIEDSIGRAN